VVQAAAEPVQLAIKCQDLLLELETLAEVEVAVFLTQMLVLLVVQEL
jgi:hypothetical protein